MLPIPWLIALGAGGLLLARELGDDADAYTIKKVRVVPKLLKPVPAKARIVNLAKATGSNPAAAAAALSTLVADLYGGAGRKLSVKEQRQIRYPGSGRSLYRGPGPNDYPLLPGFFYDLNHRPTWSLINKSHRLYGDPPGTLFVRVNDPVAVLAWQGMAPEQWHFGYRRKQKRRNANVEALNPAIRKNPGGALEILGEVLTFVGSIAETALSGAMMAGGAVTPQSVAGLSGGISDSLGAIGGQVKGAGRKAKKQTLIAGTMARPIIAEYQAGLAQWNPWAVNDKGELDLSPVYKANPKTLGDLYSRGNARPLIYLPRSREGFGPMGGVG